MKIATLTDAKTLVDNSGVSDWTWSGNANEAGLAEFVFRNTNLLTYADDSNWPGMEAIIPAYLKSVGENPSEYGY